MTRDGRTVDGTVAGNWTDAAPLSRSKAETPRKLYISTQDCESETNTACYIRTNN